MSHVSNGDLCITSLDDADEAARNLGGVLVRNQKTYKWFGKFLNDWQDTDRAAALKGFNPETFGQCDHVIRLGDHDEGDYEIGLVRRSDGKGWDAIYDVYGPGKRLEERFGVGLGRLKKEVGIVSTMRTARTRGYRVMRRTNEKGQEQVRVWK